MQEAISLSAHFDGERILLDKPYQLSPNDRLLVTVLPATDDEERREWFEFAAQAFNAAYGDDEAEYTDADLTEINPDYNGA